MIWISMDHHDATDDVKALGDRLDRMKRPRDMMMMDGPALRKGVLPFTGHPG